MWAGTITLDLDGQLVAVRFDTDEWLERARLLFAAWIDDDAPEVLIAFSLRLGGDEPLGERRGVVAVPQLRFGSRVIARSRQVDDVVRALARVLGGVHAHDADGGRVWTGLRPFVRGDDVVLVDAMAPLLVGDRRLEQDGIIEVPAWTSRISADGMVSVPPPLPQLDWAAAGADPPEGEASGGWRELRLAGMVLHDTHAHDETCDHEDTPGQLVQRAAARATSPDWFTQVTAMVEQGRVRLGHDRAELRRAIRLLFATSPPRDRLPG